MNRAALAGRVFLAITILPAAGAAGYAAYEYRHQAPATPAYHVGDTAAVTAFPSHGTLLGVFAPTLPRGGQAASDTAALASFDHAVGHSATLTVAYLNWGSPFPARYVRDAARLGARTVIELEPRGSTSRRSRSSRVAGVIAGCTVSQPGSRRLGCRSPCRSGQR